MSLKKIIIIITVILGILAMLFGVYFSWKKTKQILTPLVSRQPAEDIQLPAPISPIPKLKILSNQPIFDYWINVATSTKQIFYLNQDGLLFKIKEGGEDEAVTPEPIKNLQAIKSSFNGKLALIKFDPLASLGKAPRFLIFNSETKISEFLPESATAAAFSPDAKKIAYLETPGGNLVISNLVIKDLVGSKPKTSKILSLNQKDFDLEWILPENIILTPKPSAFSADSAWNFNIKTKIFESLDAAGLNGLMINWSIDGKTSDKLGLRFNSQKQGREGFLILINEKGEKRANFDFLTLPNKCFFSEPKIYCAVPLEIPPKTVLPDDYLKRTFYSNDSLYQIDINQNSLSEILAAGNPIIDAVRLNVIEGKLFFINRYDNKLYELEL
ncbi:hypothetical protein COS61_01395 [Candidatus Wolfebacteria bacterium CG03_land_8_20_14_0_80_40_12]|uniref:Dipeptidylpeptidase IV N-terminal domain-containing protein n=1 Tax=Candidatus Wolfebacteria bacterium CG03_land_8_20_14_0_80_40_12 TaxID=1975069 RepID=A0A2M7B5R6_9BACT|nr:MAG: hypothetical protein COS61_01395 [Candidatus Wolfebacteria bacterium CG03_land_8_20_14_0_80_40_12]